MEEGYERDVGVAHCRHCIPVSDLVTSEARTLTRSDRGTPTPTVSADGVLSSVSPELSVARVDTTVGVMKLSLFHHREEIPTIRSYYTRTQLPSGKELFE